MRQPHMINHHLLVSTQPLQDFTILPVPEHNIAFPVTRRDESSVRGEPNGACVSCDGMSGESLFTVLTESVGRVDEDLVVE
jgi:hypothetical protein